MEENLIDLRRERAKAGRMSNFHINLSQILNCPLNSECSRNTPGSQAEDSMRLEKDEQNFSCSPLSGGKGKEFEFHHVREDREKPQASY